MPELLVSYARLPSLVSPTAGAHCAVSLGSSTQTGVRQRI
jgi:hypothetical protein